MKSATQVLLLGLMLGWLAAPARIIFADDTKSKPADQKSSDSKPAQREPAKQPEKPAGDPEALRLHLMDGSMITGRLSLKDLTVETKFGTLNVPVASIRSFTPGLNSHPTLAKQIAGWIEELGSGTFNDREEAQKALIKLGPAIRAELERRRDDSDAERRTRVRAILGEFEQAQDDAEEPPSSDRSAANGSGQYIQEDTIETSEFTIVGHIVPQSFAISSLYGPLTIKMADIRRIERDVEKKEELPTNFTVTSAHMVHNGMLNTNIRLERGDSVTVSASGSILMTPWGNQASSTPDGAMNFGFFTNRQIPVGALIGKIGSGDEYIKLGSHATITAQKSGQLQLAIAMRPEQAGNEFPGSYKVKIRVTRKP